MLHAGAAEEVDEEEESDEVQPLARHKAPTKKQQKAEADRQSFLKSYNLWKEYNLELHERFIDALNYKNKKVFNIMINMMKLGWDRARRGDTNRIKAMITDLVLDNPELKNRGDHFSKPIPRFSKTKRGTNNAWIRTLLCPWCHEDLESGKIKLSENTLFCFMYDMRLHNPSSRIDGLLRGYLIPRAARALIVGPSAAFELGTGTAKKPGPAKICGITEGTPGLIFFSLTTLASWTWDKAEGVNVRRLYLRVIEIFEKANSKWLDDYWDWFNEEVFGTKSKSDDDTSEEKSEVSELFDEFEQAKKNERLLEFESDAPAAPAPATSEDSADADVASA
ncbi:hypothetical protein MPER_11908 [Moniliophthora perniciosa FA553]|nr:hypothetical protein MPER_11908 [Moniliophthora perniciosa FA553]